MTADMAGGVIGAILTLLILSYVVGDNPLYRLALHIFVGVLVGYSLGVAVRDVFLRMALPRLVSNPVAVVVPLVLGILLLFKGFPRQAFVGNYSVAYLVGVGTAVAMGGALLGTLGPQINATGGVFNASALRSFRFGVLDAVMVVVGTVCTLLTFTFSRSDRHSDRHGDSTFRGRILNGVASIGRVFLVVATGAALAGALTASLSVFIGRAEQLIDLVLQVLGR